MIDDPLKSVEAKIRKIADERKITLESIPSANVLEKERKEKEKETRLFNIAQKEAERLTKERIKNERKKLIEAAEMLKAKLLVEKMVKAEKEKRNKAALKVKTRVVPFEYFVKNPKDCPTPHGYIGEFTKECVVLGDKRIRFNCPRYIQDKIKKGQKVNVEVKLSSITPNSHRKVQQ